MVATGFGIGVHEGALRGHEGARWGLDVYSSAYFYSLAVDPGGVGGAEKRDYAADVGGLAYSAKW